MKRPSILRFGRPRLLRASDADRDAYAEIVNQAYSEGQLDAIGLEQRTSRVLNAKTVGQLDDIVSDLVAVEPAPASIVGTSKTAARPKPPQSAITAAAKRDRTIIVGAVLGSIALLGVILFASIGGSQPVLTIEEQTSEAPFPGVQVTVSTGPAVDMYTPDGLETVVAAIVEAAGGRSEFSSFGLYGAYAIASGPAADGAIRLTRYDWRNGQVSTSPGSATPDELLLVDIDDVDLAAVARLAKDAPELTGVSDPTSLYVSIDRSTSTADEVVEVRVSVSNDFQNGYLTAESTGELITIVGPAIEPDTTRFFRAEALDGALVALRARIGHDEITSMLLYPERVSADAPPEVGAEVVDSYEFRGGTRATLETYTPFQPEDVRGSVFSLDLIDAEDVAAALSQAVEASGVDDGELSYASIERPIDPAGHDPVIVVFVGNNYTSERVIYSLTGELLQVG